MIPQLKSFGTLLALVLALTCLSAPGVQAAAPNRAMPGGLMDAFPAAAAQPFQTGAEGTLFAEQKVTAPDGVAEDWFGTAVALDGDTALVGAYGDDVHGHDRQGSVYVFTRSGTTWSLQQQLTASDGEQYALFGLSVALSGSTAVVGAPGDGPGSAYVFTRAGATWGERDKLTALDAEAGDYFGESVAIDGSTILVGAYRDDIDANTDQGSAYVFAPSGLLNWEQEAKLIAEDGAATDAFGVSVALAGDTALVGAYWDDVEGNENQGSAYVFTRQEATWTQRAQLTAAGGEASDNFGYAVALDGDTALVGAYWDLAATVFTGSEATWTQQAQLTAAGGVIEDYFGCAVALDRDTAVVGAYRDTVDTNQRQGSAYIFTRSGTTWTQEAQLTASDGAAEDLFGDSVAVSGDTTLVGASSDDVDTNADQGSAYFFERLFAVYLPLVLRNAP